MVKRFTVPPRHRVYPRRSADPRPRGARAALWPRVVPAHRCFPRG